MSKATLANTAVALIERDNDDAQAEECESANHMSPHIDRLIMALAHSLTDLLRLTLVVNSVSALHVFVVSCPLGHLIKLSVASRPPRRQAIHFIGEALFINIDHLECALV